MRVRSALAMLVGLCLGCEGPSQEPPAKTPARVQPGPIKKARDGVQKANEAGLKRTDDAVDRASQSEAVDRGATPGR